MLYSVLFTCLATTHLPEVRQHDFALTYAESREAVERYEAMYKQRDCENIVEEEIPTPDSEKTYFVVDTDCENIEEGSTFTAESFDSAYEKYVENRQKEGCFSYGVKEMTPSFVDWENALVAEEEDQ